MATVLVVGQLELTTNNGLAASRPDGGTNARPSVICRRTTGRPFARHPKRRGNCVGDDLLEKRFCQLNIQVRLLSTWGLMFEAHAPREILRYASHAQENYCIPYQNCQTLFSFSLNLFFRVYLDLSRYAIEGRGIRLRIFLNNSSNFFILFYSPLSL